MLFLFGQRMMAAENKLENLIFKDARSRIVNFLHEVVAKRGRQVGYEMLLKHSLTHQDIANITWRIFFLQKSESYKIVF